MKEKIENQLKLEEAKAMVEKVISANPFRKENKLNKADLPKNFNELANIYVHELMQDLESLAKKSPDKLHDAFYALNKLAEYGWNFKENPQAYKFLREEVLKNIKDLLEGRSYVYRTPPKQAALETAEIYFEAGILNLEEDYKLFDELTK